MGMMRVHKKRRKNSRISIGGQILLGMIIILQLMALMMLWVSHNFSLFQTHWKHKDAMTTSIEKNIQKISLKWSLFVGKERSSPPY